MSGQTKEPERRSKERLLYSRFFPAVAGLVCAFLFSSCQQLKTDNTEPLYSETNPPRKQELRWSNGKAPKTFDPALATAPPETDVVRAIYEGLTDLDPKTLREIPAIAEKWTPSEDNRIWTFHLRKDAKWTNGEPVTANDFVRSWKRLVELGDKVPNHALLDNIVGTNIKKEIPSPIPSPSDTEPPPSVASFKKPQPEPPTEQVHSSPTPEIKNKAPEKEKFGVEAVSDTELKISLSSPDKDLPRLVANPLFLPVYGDGKYFEANPLDASAPTNGAFQISSNDQTGLLLKRSDTYFDHDKVALESVRFVPSVTAEKALDTYRSGDIDAVTNADLEPLALKLLSPYNDFRQATHNALNFYEVNTARAPFSDRRVREALAISIQRDHLTESEMKGSTEPAFHFLPYDTSASTKLSQDAERAQDLLESAGFPNGEGFPVIRLVVNRNDIQQRIARSVIRMWKQNLNIDAEMIVKENSEMESVWTSGEFDVIRRGVVFPTVDRKMGLAALFPDELPSRHEPRQITGSKPEGTTDARSGGPNDNKDEAVNDDTQPGSDEIATDIALFNFRVIPLYFPVSYGLVKPYVRGFDLNGLDAPLLKDVSIDNDWRSQK